MRKVKVASILLMCAIALIALVGSFTNVFAENFPKLYEVKSSDSIPLGEFAPIVPTLPGNNPDAGIPDGSLLGAPANFAAQALDCHAIMISWDPVQGAEGYRIYRAHPDSPEFTEISATPYGYIIDSDLAAGEAYTYTVEAYTGKLSGPRATAISASTKTAGTDAPSGASAEGIDAESILLEWNPVDGADGYYIYRCANEFGSYSYVGTATEPSYTDHGLNSSTIYYYVISAYDSGGTGKRSLPVSALTKIAPPGTPSGVTVQKQTDDTYQISWDPVPGASGYFVYCSTDGSYGYIGSTDVTSFLHNTSKKGVTLYYVVSAFNDGGTGHQSAPAIVTSPKGQGEVPVVTVGMPGISSLSVNWTPVGGADGYTVYRSETIDGHYSSVYQTSALYVSDTGLLPGKTYYYKVSATFSGRPGPQSAPAYGTTASILTDAPNVSIQALGTGGVRITWTPIEGASGYNVYRSTESNGDYELIGSTDALNLTDNNLKENTTYYYVVAAEVSDSDGMRSGPVSVKTQTADYPAPRFWLTESGDSMACEWSLAENDGFTHFRIYRATNPSGPYTLTADCRPAIDSSGSTMQWVDNNQAPGQIYYYKMSVVDISGNEGAVSKGYNYWLAGQPGDEQFGAGGDGSE